MGRIEKTKEENKKTENQEVIYDVGQEQTPVQNQKTITFKSLHRGTLVFIEPDNYIRFVNHLYQTNDEEMIEFLRNHPAFGLEIFEGEFPDWVKEKFKKDKQFINYFNPEDETIIG